MRFLCSGRTCCRTCFGFQHSTRWSTTAYLSALRDQDTEEVAGLLASAEAPGVFLDRGVRRDRRLYLRVVRRQLDCGALSLGLRQGVTSVSSPSRRSSVLPSRSRSPRPHPVQNWRSSLGETLQCTQFDLADAFHHIELQVALQEFFSLPAVEKRELGITSVARVPVDDTTPFCRWR